MRKAALYTAKVETVLVSGDYVKYMTVDNTFRSYNSDDILISDTFKRTDLPVERWYDENRNEFFIALDPILRKMVEHRIGTRAVELMRTYNIEKSILERENKQLQERTIWDMIKLKFKRRKK